MDTPISQEKSQSAGLARGYTLALVATMMWSFTGIFIRYLNVHYGVPPLVQAFWRDLFIAAAGTAALLVLRPAWLRAGRDHLGYLAVYGLVLALFNSLWTISVTLNGAAVATVLCYSSPAFTTLLAWRMFGERFDKVMAAAVLLSLAGSIMVAGAYNPAVWQLNPTGILAGLLSGLGMAAYSLFGRSAAHRGLPPWTTITWSFAFAALFLLPISQVFTTIGGTATGGNLFFLGSALAGWGILLAYALGPSIGGYGLFMISLTHLPAAVANLIATLEPVLTAILAFFLLGERLTTIQLFGSLLIVGGVVALRVKGE